MKFSITDFFADLVTFTEKILMENLIFCPAFAFLDNYFF